jgi:Family of unknown function (DUF6152)
VLGRGHDDCGTSCGAVQKKAVDMNVKLTNRVAIGLVLLLTGAQVVAHHSESAQFDTANPIEVTGVVTKVEWSNPHIWFYVDVKDDTGKITTWASPVARPECSHGEDSRGAP